MHENESDQFQILLNSLNKIRVKEIEMKNKITFQEEEINKSLNFIDQFEKCLGDQHQMLSELNENAIEVTNNKGKISREIQCLDDESEITTQIVIEQSEDQSKSNRNNKNEFVNEIESQNATVYSRIMIGRLRNQSKRIERKKNVNKLPSSASRNVSDGNEFVNEIESQNATVYSRIMIGRSRNQSKRIERKKNVNKLPSSASRNVSDGKPNVTSAKLTKIFVGKHEVYTSGCGGALEVHKYNKATKTIPSGTTDDILGFYLISEKLLLYTASELILTTKLYGRNMLHCADPPEVLRDFKPDTIINVLRLNKLFQVTLENGESWDYNFYEKTFTNVFSWKLRLKSIITKLNQSVALTSDLRLYRSIGYGTPLEIKSLGGCQDIYPSSSEEFVVIFPTEICWVDWKTYIIKKRKKIYVPVKSFSTYCDMFMTVDVENTVKTFQKHKGSEMVVRMYGRENEVTAISDHQSQKLYVAVNNQIKLIASPSYQFP